MNKAPITVEQDEIMNFLQRMYVKTQGTVFSGDKKVIKNDDKIKQEEV
jgi:hypothetical protein